MFLHSGASLHGHEYSVARSTQPAPPRRIPLIRSALRPLSDSDTTALSSSTSSTHRSSLPPSSPSAQRRSTLIPPNSQNSSTNPRRLSQPAKRASTVPTPVKPNPRPTSEYIPKRAVSVRFTDAVEVMERPPRDKKDLPGAITAESDTDDVLDEAPSEHPSDYSETSTLAERRTKRTPRSSTKYILAQPAPRLATKQRRLVQIRPRLLLQLQQVTDTRPKPAFDALPSSLVSGPVIAPRVARKFPRLLRMKPELGLDDIILARSEDYDAPDSTSDDGSSDELDRRELLGVVSPVPREAAGCAAEGVVEVALENDIIWTGFPLSNGSYEFTRIDEAGNKVTARWAKKAIGNRHSTGGGAAVGTNPMEHKYIFSVLDPSSRRHPVLATLTSTHLEINDSYTSLAGSSSRSPPTRSTAIGFAVPDMIPSPVPERQTLTIDDPTRTLITATAVWVTLRSQFAWPSPRLANGVCRSRNSVSKRPTSLNVASNTANAVVSHPPQGSINRAATFPLADTGGFSRPVSLDGRTLVVPSTPTSAAMMDGAAGTGVRGSLVAFPRRAMSTGAAFMRRRRAVTITESSDESTTRGTVVSEETEVVAVTSGPVVLSIPAATTATDSEDVDEIPHIKMTPILQSLAPEEKAGFRGKVKGWKDRLALRIKSL